MDVPACERHGTATPVTCVTCEKPLCPRCLVATPVGFKCEEHARVATVPPRSVRRRRPGPPAGARRAGLGGLGLLPLLFVLLVFPVLTGGLNALFGITGNRTGIVGALPLLALFAVLIVGTVLLIRRVSR